MHNFAKGQIVVEYVVEKEYSGRSVKEITARALGISSATLKHLKFLDNGIMKNGSRVNVREILYEGDVLSLATEDTENGEKLKAVELALRIAYEDSELTVPDKPADMPTHPSRDHYDDTVANALAFRYNSMGLPFVFRPVNRLDRNTSGLLLIARNRLSANTLSCALREGRIRKQYVAILDGTLPESEGLIETYIRRTAESIIVREVCGEGEGGDHALTKYKTLLSENGHSIVYAWPLTGRTHQLRVHFASLGAPITGDDMYGSSSELISRHALHSHVLSFPHPTDGREVCVRAPMHPDMESLARALFSAEALTELSERESGLFSGSLSAETKTTGAKD